MTGAYDIEMNVSGIRDNSDNPDIGMNGDNNAVDRGDKSGGKMAIFFPGIGYHKGKPLLYYSIKLMQQYGYEIRDVEYHDMPVGIKGNDDLMRKAGRIAFEQTCEQLGDIDFTEYGDVVLIGKSIGTVVLARFAEDYNIDARQIWYTPVEETFNYAGRDVIAFFGEADPLSDTSVIKEKAEHTGIKLHTYPYGNHSIESGDVCRDTGYLHEIMKLTEEFVLRKTNKELH